MAERVPLSVDLKEIRRLIVAAVASDDLLAQQLILKGGNALDLVHGIGGRTSLDLDFSIEGDFEDTRQIEARLFQSLRQRFEPVGFVVFDETFVPRPKVSRGEKWNRWGGYTAAFKLVSSGQHRELRGDIGAMRRQAHVSGPRQQRIFTIDISKYEYCRGKAKVKIQQCTCYVYTPQMIAVEKLRAICQQMPEYSPARHPTPRARDFYDVHAIVTAAGVNLAAPEQIDMIRHMFEAKEVPLRLLGSIDKYREFHRLDWPAVQSSVAAGLQDFDFYFDFLVAEVQRLERLWIE